MFCVNQETYPLSRSNGLPPRQGMAEMFDRDFCFVPFVAGVPRKKPPLRSDLQKARSMLGVAKRTALMAARHEQHKPEIARMLADGRTMKEIGAAIGMSTTYVFKCIKLNGLSK